MNRNMKESQEKKISKFAIFSFVCACIHIALIVIALLLPLPWPPFLRWTGSFYPMIIFSSGTIAFLLGIVALIMIFLRKQKLKGRGLALGGIILPTLSLIIAILFPTRF